MFVRNSDSSYVFVTPLPPPIHSLFQFIVSRFVHSVTEYTDTVHCLCVFRFFSFISSDSIRQFHIQTVYECQWRNYIVVRYKLTQWMQPVVFQTSILLLVVACEHGESNGERVHRFARRLFRACLPCVVCRCIVVSSAYHDPSISLCPS